MSQQPELTDIKRESISLSDFLPKTQQGMAVFCDDNECLGLIDTRAPLNQWALLYFKLRKAKDRAEWFPSGKWATLQRLEQLLEDAV
jgi:hypothetical protein